MLIRFFFFFVVLGLFKNLYSDILAYITVEIQIIFCLQKFNNESCSIQYSKILVEEPILFSI